MLRAAEVKEPAAIQWQVADPGGNHGPERAFVLHRADDVAVYQMLQDGRCREGSDADGSGESAGGGVVAPDCGNVVRREVNDGCYGCESVGPAVEPWSPRCLHPAEACDQVEE